MKRVLKDTHRGDGIMHPIAVFMNAVSRIINGTEVMSGGFCDVTSSGLKFHLDVRGYPYGSQWAWGIEWRDATTLRVFPGAFIIHGIGKYETAQTDVALTGSTEWIYAEYNRGTGYITVGHQATEPDDAGGSSLLKRLYKLTRQAGGSYSLDKCYVHEPDL